ncbi:restriction endonuclease [Herbaspirillum frisingense]|uniref:DNA methyltransferase n=1 Tax=Herbaspirillum frisingense TaxID=92645 RepID=UPI001600F3AF|nr:DNA methyltransferase [Herbaspirillum frisingense]QNB05771.1 restriction endonuclease [Herbaspirillum frisingense]
MSFTDDDTRFMGHDLHPYPAKFIPQLPGTFVSLLSSRGELIFDPFGGSGTTALESIRLGRRAVSVDANPMAALIGKVKTARVDPESAAKLHLLHGALKGLLDHLPTNPSELAEKYGSYAPVIANCEKWFADSAFGELAHIKFRISRLDSEIASNIALLALSRTVLSASFQDSETRYKSVPRDVPIGETTRRYVKEFESVMKSVAQNAPATRYGISRFITSDVRHLQSSDLLDNSVDLIVTSPPYGNATDYHLYHRFRLLWLGFDPIALGKIEIGSHLKHQREASGFESYFSDMVQAVSGMSRVLKHGRYAVLVIGDSVYNGEKFDTARLLADKASELGFEANCVIDRALHKTKRSFSIAGRRAASESILILRKAAHKTSVLLHSPPYKMWPYEMKLREGELPITKNREAVTQATLKRSMDIAGLLKARQLVFTHKIEYPNGLQEPTWQAILENGTAANPVYRKDPKYVTHGLHIYKGKFYPQLAKGLINQLALEPGAKILDPFCGSGTTLLEGHLNGYATYGCDLNPLASLIARAKTQIIEVDPDLVTEVVSAVLDTIENPPADFPVNLEQFPEECLEEIARWFATPIAQKLNWLLAVIRSGSDGTVREFLEVIFSSIVRDVSQQEPTDLRIRYRKELLEDADVLGLFKAQLSLQFERIEKFWKIRGYAPHQFLSTHATYGDNRLTETYDALGLSDDSVDLVLTSPPYAMALPYIDTDRLSLLTLFGMSGTERRPLEHSLTGSREINTKTRRTLEEDFLHSEELPPECRNFVRGLHEAIIASPESGFRKINMPALVHRFLKDMDAVLRQIYRLCKSGAEAMIVIGDSKMTVDGTDIRIPTTDLIEIIAISHGFNALDRIDISVTTENYLHIKNAITENVVLRLKK